MAFQLGFAERTHEVLYFQRDSLQVGRNPGRRKYTRRKTRVALGPLGSGGEVRATPGDSLGSRVSRISIASLVNRDLNHRQMFLTADAIEAGGVPMHEQALAAMRQSIIDGAPETARDLAYSGLAHGLEPFTAINDGYVPGMQYVGEQFAQRMMFLPDMMASAEAMRAAMSVLEPELTKRGAERPTAGIVILGTAKGDIHEIGKSLVGTLLAAHGFRVHDLGADVSSETFVAKTRELNADVVGVSALLTTTMRGQKSVIESLEREGLRSQVKVIIGGAPVTRQWAEEIGADGYSKDAMGAVTLVQNLLQREPAHAQS